MDTFVLENFAKQSTFASFLPGICGVRGIPIWCFYVNRGQGVVSFGVDDKENSIMEFYPAHQAYQNVKTTGFRTFIKINGGAVYEPFSDEDVPSRMEISMNLLELQEDNPGNGLSTRVSYYTLPNEKIGALVRVLTITNTSDSPVDLEIVDGMGAVIPCGVGLKRMKEISQTAKAWMQAEDVDARRAYYRVRASILDSAEVAEVVEGNYALGFTAEGTLLPVIADPSLVFAYDTSMRRPVALEMRSLEETLSQKQVTFNVLPSAFFARTISLPAGGSTSIYELYGQARSKKVLDGFLSAERTASYFQGKRQEAVDLTQDLTDSVATRTASASFDAYCRNNYLDNVLRGGFPIRIGSEKVFYVYSRKHGDLERDYNEFAMLPEYYSQGNGAFRDVNQNRRCDTFFAPYVGRENIRKFYSLIQLDGYNPLGIEKLTYKIDPECLRDASTDPRIEALCDWLKDRAFTPGSLYHFLEEQFDPQEADRLFERIMDRSKEQVNDKFGEGYWSDHWTYNLDLVEDYLEVFPDREKELLYDEYLTCYLTQVPIRDRQKRCVETPRGLRQYHALDESRRLDGSENLVRTGRQTGEILHMSLLEKLSLLCAVKFAALDPYGMGIEMEGGKPGWYDALNGLPGMFGSSMNETYELCRMLDFTAAALRRYMEAVPVLAEVSNLLQTLDQINCSFRESLHRCDALTDAGKIRDTGALTAFWNEINDAKEAYRHTVYDGISGEKIRMDAQDLAQILEGYAETVRSGIHKAMVLGQGSVPAYFYYNVPRYTVTQDGIRPEVFEPVSVPHFLEGAVRCLKLSLPEDEKKEIYRMVKSSDLYDEKLKMYKVNASLGEASYELGRAVAFTPGWLENESVWMHMEYKYLLELIRSGLYEEFFEDFRNAAVPFMDPSVYGRSVYENSSFLVSSAYPDETIHGKGFVARLSGSTAEFISIWKRMMFGAHVIAVQDQELVFAPSPALPRYLVPEDGLVSAALFGGICVTYHLADRKDYIPGRYEILSMQFTYEDGRTLTTEGAFAGESIPIDLREGRIRSVDIRIL